MYRLEEGEAYFLVEGYELHEMYLDYYYSCKEGNNYGNP